MNTVYNNDTTVNILEKTKDYYTKHFMHLIKNPIRTPWYKAIFMSKKSKDASDILALYHYLSINALLLGVCYTAQVQVNFSIILKTLPKDHPFNLVNPGENYWFLTPDQIFHSDSTNKYYDMLGSLEKRIKTLEDVIKQCKEKYSNS